MKTTSKKQMKNQEWTPEADTILVSILNNQEYGSNQVERSKYASRVFGRSWSACCKRIHILNNKNSIEITDFAQSHRFTRNAYTFNLIINGKEVEGTYEWEESASATSDDMVLENDAQLTDKEYEAVYDYVCNNIWRYVNC